ncbi:fibronectin type III domain-containing protein [Balneicella halophila]|uniref:fibronectin type III domain-containing protein n=1 Tax=Balneicella halophila TaxID=1537566 RepID=UPI000E3073DA|nr:fibronectin type III domain-containing protein [Balneicella halophila]
MFRKKISLLISLITFLFITNSFSQIDPYLQAVSPNSIHINWIYSEETSKVIYGTSPDNLENEVIGSYDDFCNYNYHSIKLENLAPNTKYYYKVMSGNLSSDIFSFKTLPNPGEAVTQDGHIRLLILGDNQLNNERYEKFVRAAKKKITEKYGPGSPDDAVTSIFMVGD